MIHYIQPVTYVLTIAIYRKFLSLKCIVDDQRNQGLVTGKIEIRRRLRERQQALQIAGGTMIEKGMYGSHVVHDRELITGQNPASDLELAQELDRALQAK